MMRLFQKWAPISRRGCCSLLILWLCAGGSGLHSQAQAAEISVGASFTPDSTALGEPVNLAVTVTGSQKVRQPPAIRMEGAQVQYLGPSLQTTINNFEMTVTMTYRYYVTPNKLGDLLLPPVEIEIEGKRYQTQPATLHVLQPGQAGLPEANQGVLVELEVPKRAPYIGEAFPVEARILVPAEVRWSIRSMPDFTSDAFVKTPFQQPFQRQQNRNGREYDVVSFRSVLTAVKSGNVALGPVGFKIQMASPKKRDRGASPFGGIFDGFPFDSEPTVLQERVLRVEEQRVQVRELPAEGKPDSFRGAVGNFRFSVISQQPKIKVGEPLNLMLQVEGEGNFDRIEVPPLVNAEGWRVYPPETNFTKSDDSGLRGVKTFRIAVVPEVNQRQTPQFEFASFDPSTGRYSTQVSRPVALEVEGGLPVQPQPKAQPAPVAPPKPTPPQPPILQTNTVPVAEAPLGWRPTTIFWQVQGGLVALLSLWGLVRWNTARLARRGPGPALRKEAASRASRLKRLAGADAFLEEAIRVLQLRAAARTGRPFLALGEDELAAAFGWDSGVRGELRWLFEMDASARFAGARGETVLDEAQRGRVMALVERSAL